MEGCKDYAQSIKNMYHIAVWPLRPSQASLFCFEVQGFNR